MLYEIFYWALNASIVASLAGVFILLIRKIKKLPRLAIYMLWFVPFIRFWIPFGFSTRFSLLNILDVKTILLKVAAPEFSMQNFMQTADRYFPISFKTPVLQELFSIAGAIWLAGALALVVVFSIIYIKSKPKDLAHVSENIYTSPQVEHPAVYGILRPKIVLPAGCMAQDYIITHENVHIKRQDNLWRLLALLTACMHWFNPLAWVFIKYFNVDSELACDCKVAKNLSETQKREYAEVILMHASSQMYMKSAFGSTSKQRIQNVLSYKKLKGFSILCFAVLTLAIAFMLITNSK